MAASVTATIDPTYGVINGYTSVDSSGTFGTVATVINARTTDVVQFANGESSGITAILHSAVGFPSAAFPPAPNAFPVMDQQPLAMIISSGPWSTGRLQSGCFSQAFALTVGTYYFGDYDYYNLANMRDVIQVAQASAASSKRAPLSRRQFHSTH